MAGHSLVPSTRGEAAVVDLGPRGLLFALLIRDETRKQSTSRGKLEYEAFPDLDRQAQREAHGESGKGIAYFVDALNRLRPRAEVWIATVPLLVRFRDPRDPKTIARVDPFNLAASFGAGVELTRAAVEVTDEPASTGIEKTLPWLVGGAPEQPLTPHTEPRRPLSEIMQVDRLIYNDFSTFDRFTFF